MSSIQNRRQQLLGRTFLWAAVIAGLSVLPGSISERILAREWLYNVAHAASYGLLTWLLCLVFRFWRFPRVRTVLFSCLLALVWGAVNEWAQTFVPDRYAEWSDMLMNTAGVCLGSAVFLIRDLAKWPRTTRGGQKKGG